MDTVKEVTSSDLWRVVAELTNITLATNHLEAYREVLHAYYSGQWCDYGWSTRIEIVMPQ